METEEWVAYHAMKFCPGDEVAAYLEVRQRKDAGTTCDVEVRFHSVKGKVVQLGEILSSTFIASDHAEGVNVAETMYDAMLPVAVDIHLSRE